MAVQDVRVAPGGRHLIHADGTMFLYLADTAWELAHRLRREAVLSYLNERKEQGFTALQVVALAECDGLAVPNAYGRRPLHKGEDGRWDPRRLDVGGPGSYWDHMDFIIEQAGLRDMYVALLPTWGDKVHLAHGKGPEIFDAQNAYAYGLALGKRYAGTPNLIWVLGGDRPLTERRHFEVYDRMARGLREGDAGRHLITFHPAGGQSSATAVHHEDWLDFNMIQSGHDRRRYNWRMLAADWARAPAKPILDGEPGYEDHPDAFTPANGYLDAVDVRQFAYMAVFSGACGHTYGHHSVWGFVESIPVEGYQPGHFCMTWRDGMYRPGAQQMRHLKALVLSRDFLSAAPRPDLIAGQLDGVLHIPALLGSDFLLAYTAQGQPVRLASAPPFNNRLIGCWYNPREGSTAFITDVAAGLAHGFRPPSGGRGNDWVLVLDVEGRYGFPGKGIVDRR